ncbi:MAG: cytochrome c [Nitrosomonadales bacterium]|nr:cytochrome c [Nitrosomonadales bacterium]
MALNGLKRGEKVVLGIIGLFFAFALVSYIIMEAVRMSSDKPMYPNTTHYDFSPVGLHGSEVFREARCTSCHRAVRGGTNMGLDLDGIGSKRSMEYLESFLRDPEATYQTRTLDHGPAPKEAAYVAKLPEADRKAIATFLSELRADQGSGAARLPVGERSSFVDGMVKMWAPEGWKTEYTDIREEARVNAENERKHDANAK